MNSTVFTFAEFEFDAASGELRRGTSSVRLEPQPARVLALLVQRAGDVVTRTELQEHVWGGDTFVDFEHGLNYCIAQIRTALADSASTPRFVETLPRRGYRFIATITGVPAAVEHEGLAGSNPKEDVQSGGVRQPIRRAWGSFGRTAWIAAVAIVLAAAAAWVLVSGRRPNARERPVRIAVVAFDNETGNGAYDRLAQTLTDATVARLAADSDRLAVIGNAAALVTPRRFRDLTVIGERLDVEHVVLGQVQQIDGQLRITTHLIRVRDQVHLWAHRFEPAAAEMSSLDRQVSEAVAGAVVARLLGP